MNNRPLASLVAGTIIVVATLATWLLASLNDIETTALLAFVVPVVGALFLSGGITQARDAAQAAALQTNGSLNERIKSAVTDALRSRDAARTWQAAQAGEVQLPPLLEKENSDGG